MPSEASLLGPVRLYPEKQVQNNGIMAYVQKYWNSHFSLYFEESELE